MSLTLKILLDTPTAVMPAFAHEHDAGADLRAVMPEGIDYQEIGPGQRMLISTGLRMEVPPGYEVQIRPRSGLALKHGVTVLNTPGTIDATYRGVVGVILANFGNETFAVHPGDRIAQMVVANLPDVKLEEAVSLSETQRGSGGFGSTGTQ